MSATVFASVTTGTDEQAQLPFWEWKSANMQLRLVQRLPDQTRAFFAGRGFSPSDVEQIAQSCVFQSIYKNISHPDEKLTINYDLSQWQVIHKGKVSGLKLRETWTQQWQQQKVPSAAIIAFQWSLLPTQQTYQAADFNWGMTIFNLPPGSVFDLKLIWRENDIIYTGNIPKITCAPDIDLSPKKPLE